MKRLIEQSEAGLRPAPKAAKTTGKVTPGHACVQEQQQQHTPRTNTLKRGPGCQGVPDLQASPKRARACIRYIYEQDTEEVNKENQGQDLSGADQLSTQPSAITCSQPGCDQSDGIHQQVTAVPECQGAEEQPMHKWRSPVPLHKAGNIKAGMDTPWGILTPSEDRCTSGASRERHRAGSRSPWACGSGAKLDLYGRFSKLELSFSSSFRTEPVYGLAASNRTSSCNLAPGAESLHAQHTGSIGCTGVTAHLSVGSSSGSEAAGRNSAPAAAPATPPEAAAEKHVQVSIRCFVRPLPQRTSGSQDAAAAVTITPVADAMPQDTLQQVAAARASQPEPDVISSGGHPAQVPGAAHRYRQLTFSNSLAVHFQAKQQQSHSIGDGTSE